MQNKINNSINETQFTEWEWLNDDMDNNDTAIDIDEEYNRFIDHQSRVKVVFEDDPDLLNYTLYVDGVKIETVRLFGVPVGTWKSLYYDLERKGFHMIGKRDDKFPIYKKSVTGMTFWKILDSKTVLTIKWGALNINHYSQFTINDLLNNIQDNYKDSNEDEWNEALQDCEKRRVG